MNCASLISQLIPYAMKVFSIMIFLVTFSFVIGAQNSHIQVVAESGISVFLDGQFKGVTSFDFGGLIIQNVTRGQHTIKVVKDGYGPREEEINVKEGEVLQYHIANDFTPAIKIYEEGNEEKQAITIKNGILTIQSLPIRISIRIPSIDIDYIKKGDKLHVENIPEGIYLAEFSWNDKFLSDSVPIRDGMITYLFVNMIDDTIENKEIKIIDQQPGERSRRGEEQRHIDQANTRARGSFSNTGNLGTSDQSQGVPGGQGNQGVKSGTPDTPNSGPGGGLGTDGITFDLGGRKAQYLYKPLSDLQQEGIIVVAVTIDRSGRVTDATPGIKGSTTLDGDLLKLAKEAALKTRFESSSDAPLIQKGTITYFFRQK